MCSKNKAFAESVKSFHPGMKEKYDATERKLSSRPDGFFMKINGSRVLTTATEALTETEEKSIEAAGAAITDATKLMNDFLNSDWTAYQKNLEGKQISIDSLIK
jgi:hypothetical protein